jgi:hypothetical protein
MTKSDIAIHAAQYATGLKGVDAVVSPCRKFRFIEARMIVVLLLTAEGYTDSRIGDVLHRSRTTILSARRSSDYYYSESETFRNKFAKAKQYYDERVSVSFA